jgi:hypothetical protein
MITTQVLVAQTVAVVARRSVPLLRVRRTTRDSALKLPLLVRLLPVSAALLLHLAVLRRHLQHQVLRDVVPAETVRNN